MKKVMYIIYVVIFLITVGLFFTSCEKDTYTAPKSHPDDDYRYECVVSVMTREGRVFTEYMDTFDTQDEIEEETKFYLYTDTPHYYDCVKKPKY